MNTMIETLYRQAAQRLADVGEPKPGDAWPTIDFAHAQWCVLMAQALEGIQRTTAEVIGEELTAGRVGWIKWDLLEYRVIFPDDGVQIGVLDERRGRDMLATITTPGTWLEVRDGDGWRTLATVGEVDTTRVVPEGSDG